MTAQRSREIIGHVRNFSAATILTQIITLASSIIMRRFLGPVQTGVWSIVQIILNYLPYTTIGTTDAASRQIPAYRGRKNLEAADQMKDLVFTFGMVTSVISGVGILIYTFAFGENFRQEVFIGLIFTSVLVVLQRLNNILIMLLRAYKEFSVAAQQMIWTAVANAILIALLAYRFQLYGFLFAMCLSVAFSLVFILTRSAIKFHLTFNWRPLWGMIRLGMPLMITGLVETFFLTLDRIMIVTFLGLEAAGFYSIAVLAYTYMGHFPNAVGIVLAPNFEEMYGESQNPHSLKKYIDETTQAFMNTIPVLIGIAWFLGPPLLTLLLPKFAEGLDALRYLVVCSFFVSLNQPFWNFVVATRRHVKFMVITLLMLGIAACFDYHVIKQGFGIEGIALVTGVLIFVRFLILFIDGSGLIYTGKEWGMKLLEILGKFAYMISALLILNLIQFPGGSYVEGVFRCVIFIILYIPFFLSTVRKLLVRL